MLRKLLLGFGALIVLVIAYFAYLIFTTRSHSPQDTIRYENEQFKIEVVYCQPYKKGRLIFGDKSEGALVPYGEYWRTGANEATEIEFSTAVQFGETTVEQGRYRLYTVPGENTWKVALNSELGAWGYYEPDYQKDVVSIEVAPQVQAPEIEQFTMSFAQEGKRIMLQMKWESTLVEVPIQPME